MSNGITIEPASDRDIESLGRIWSELMELHESRDERFALAPDALARWQALAREMLSRQDGFLLNARVAGELSGFCLGWVARNPAIYAVREVGFISEIAVARAHRRRGVGRALIGAAASYFLERGLTEFQLSTAVWNEDARAFWCALAGEPLLVRYRFDTFEALAAAKGHA